MQIFSKDSNLNFKKVENLYGLLKALLMEARKKEDGQCAVAILMFLDSRQSTIEFVYYLISLRIEQSNDSKVILRESSYDTFFLTYVCRDRGHSFLKEMLGEAFELIKCYPQSFEINPDKIKNTFFLSSHRSNVSGICEKIIHSLVENVENIPSEIRTICTIMKVLSYQKFKDDEIANYTSTAFFFLRFLSHAIALPDFWLGKTDSTDSVSQMRSALVYISKLIQTWAQNIRYEVTKTPQTFSKCKIS